jgi:hypothetical protein
VGIYQDGDEKFEVLVWDDDFSWIAAVCGPDWYHGGYPMSYRWWMEADGPAVWCRPTKGDIYDILLRRGNKLRQIAAASIHVHIATEPWPEGWE